MTKRILKRPPPPPPDLEQLAIIQAIRKDRRDREVKKEYRGSPSGKAANRKHNRTPGRRTKQRYYLLKLTALAAQRKLEWFERCGSRCCCGTTGCPWRPGHPYQWHHKKDRSESGGKYMRADAIFRRAEPMYLKKRQLIEPIGIACHLLLSGEQTRLRCKKRRRSEA